MCKEALNGKGGTLGFITVYGIAALGFFSCLILAIEILMCSIAVCGFSSFWLMVVGKRRSFTVLWYRSFALSCLIQGWVVRKLVNVD